MSDDDNSKLISEINSLKEKLEKLEGKNAELMDKNTELTNQNIKLMEGIGETKLEKQQQNTTQPADASKLKEKFNDLELKEKLDGKRTKMGGVSVPNWLIEVIEWIKRIEMADSSLSTSSWTFKQLCWPKLHLNVKPHVVQRMKICGDDWKHSKKIQIPTTAPPNYIIGFKEILIDLLNGRVMKFIENILPILNGIHLYFDPIRSDSNDPVRLPLYCLTTESFGQIHCLFEMLAKNAFAFKIQRICDFVRWQPKAMDILEKIQFIKTDLGSQNIDFLLKWVTTNARVDQKPKMLRLVDVDRIAGKFIDKIEEEFSGATNSTNFLIRFVNGYTNYEESISENEQTGEILELKFDGHRRKNLFRFKLGEEHLKLEWKKQIKGKDSPTSISAQITQIGEF